MKIFRRKRKQPDPPEGVVLVFTDGTEYAPDLLYRGIDTDGTHLWEACLPRTPTMGEFEMRIARLPAHTGVTCPVLPP